MQTAEAAEEEIRSPPKQDDSSNALLPWSHTGLFLPWMHSGGFTDIDLGPHP